MSEPASTQVITVDAILFDMDGTLIDSTPGVLKAWEIFAKDYALPGDPLALLHETHGRRLYDTLKQYCRITHEDMLAAEIDRFEDEVIQGGPMALPGVVALLEQLNQEMPDAWTIVTSASNKYTPRALMRASVPLPKAGLVTANDVSQGKPHPAPYEAGARRVGVDVKNCLVVEDAISGLRSGRAAGARTLAVCTSTTKEVIIGNVSPDYLVSDLTRISVRHVNGQVEVTIGC